MHERREIHRKFGPKKNGAENVSWKTVALVKSIILKFIIRKRREDMNWIYLGHNRDPDASSCEHNNEPLGSFKRGKYRDKLISY